MELWLVCVVIAMAACGGSPSATEPAKPEPPGDPRSMAYTLDQAIAQLTRFRDKACACRDETCAQAQVSDESSWQAALFSVPPRSRHWDFTEVDQQYMIKLTQELFECARAAVPPIDLEAHLIAGDKNIKPDDVFKTELERRGKSRLEASIKMCIDEAGSITSTKFLKTSGFQPYDDKLQHEMSAWRFSPVMIGGKPADLCATVTFTYTQGSAEALIAPSRTSDVMTGTLAPPEHP